MTRIRSTLRVLAALTLALAAAASARDDGMVGDWRVYRVQPAPWVESERELGPAALALGQRIVFEADGLSGPPVLRCERGQYQRLALPPEGLFQGGLPDPRRNAEALGFAVGEVSSWRLDCANASFDFHLADADSALFALDNRIYSFSRANGARAEEGSPAAAVQSLLEQHFAGDMGFTEALWADKRAALTAALNAEIDAYLAAAWPKDEVPPINGDPLTDSQEYPTRFAVRQAHGDGLRVPVEVDFADAWTSKRLVYTMEFDPEFEDGRWLLRDVHGESGESFTDVLRERP